MTGTMFLPLTNYVCLCKVYVSACMYTCVDTKGWHQGFSYTILHSFTETKSLGELGTKNSASLVSRLPRERPISSRRMDWL